MNKQRLERFKELLSVPSHFFEEDEMVEYLIKLLDNEYPDVEYYLDHMNNIYITKKTEGYDSYLPCYVAHTDTVHKIEDYVVHEGKKVREYTFGKHFYDGDEGVDALFAKKHDGSDSGIGGDDKAGIFTCLEILRLVPNCKVAFFVSEEVGMIGSKEADVTFFDDVSFICQFDAPGNHLITHICSGVELFDEEGLFFNGAKPLITSTFGDEVILGRHPYTDVMALREKTGIACINLSCGYYNMHSRKEFVVPEDVEKAITVGIKLTTIATTKYTK